MVPDVFHQPLKRIKSKQETIGAMNKFYSIVAAVGSFAASALAYDGRINIGPTPGAAGTSPGGGGPFTVTVTQVNSVGMAQLGSPFLAFCLERSENINLNNNQGYYVNISNMAINGGGGPNPDPLSLVTAYLYSQYRAGNIATTPAGAADLQNAIWWMEQEITDGQRTAGSTILINNALSALNLNAATYGTSLGTSTATQRANLRGLNANGAYGVRALNVYSNPGLTSLNQDMLTMVPEPSTYAAAALLMLPVLIQARRMRRSA